MHGLTVIKVGGSLLDWRELPERITAFLDEIRAGQPILRTVLIPGGGLAADSIRLLDRIHGLGAETAHRLALHSLDLTAEILAALLPWAITIQRPEVIYSVGNAGLVPILAPRRFLDEIDRLSDDRLAASWDVTSDTIAARIAVSLKADRLILLKSTDAPPGIGRAEAARIGLVDRVFPEAARELARVAFLNLRNREGRLHELSC